VLVVGGGFGGASVARILGRRGATVVNAQNSMLFTPMLPEVAAGVIEVRNAMTPLAMMCPAAEVIAGRVTDLDLGGRTAEVQSDGGLELRIDYDHIVIAVGAVPRTFPIPGLVEHAVGCTTVLDALYLRNQLLRLLAAAAIEPDSERRRGLLTFVFIGGGYAGVETLAELHHLAEDALRYHPTLCGVPQRWVLVDAAPRILAEIPSELGRYVNDLLVQRGVDMRLNTRLEKVVDGRVTLSDGSGMDTGLLVWTAGVKADPIVAHFGLPLDERGRVCVGPTLQVHGHDDVWALGDCASVPNAATPGRVDPPTSQHALRQARRLAANHRHPGRRYAASLPVPLTRAGRHPRADRGHSGPERGAAQRLAGMAGGSRCPPHAGPRCLPAAGSAERLDPGSAVPPQSRHAVGTH
jgi:NADH:ubiquinone reductase (H+-translocating)